LIHNFMHRTHVIIGDDECRASKSIFGPKLLSTKTGGLMYLITGATGEIGSRVVRQLLERGIRPRVLTRSAEKASSLFGERVDICVGDLAVPGSIKAAIESVNTLFLVNVGPEIPERDKAAAIISKDSHVQRIVKLSSLDVEQGLAIGAWHEKGEAAIRDVGIPFTFVRPTGFMSNLLAWAHSIKTEGVVHSSTADGRRPFIHSQDIASVCVAALLQEEYTGQALPITGPESLTFGEATDIIGGAIGRRLLYRAISDEEAHERYSKVSGSPEETEAHVALWRAIREGRLAATTDCVERVLGRRPITLGHWAAENASSFLR
jgi:(4-alkanoyl-5-oxo-2,5-dihydrofuran-3-yl)methyl phosphate reductase